MCWNWDRRFVHQVIATLIREGRRDLLHEFMVAAMSLDTAKTLLGFDPDADPNDDEVSRAWKKKALEHHPDRGGDPEVMKQINVAHDVLTGKQRPDRGSGFSPRRPGPATGPTGPAWSPPPPVERKKTFEEALKDAGGIPSGVKWKFKTVTGYGGYGDERHAGYVVYGASESVHVFVGVYHHRVTPTTNENTNIDEYEIQVRTFPIGSKLALTAPKVIREMWKRFPNVKGYGAKVYILPDGTELNRKLDYFSGRKVSFKDAIGLMGEETPSTWKGKVNVELELGRDEKFGENPAILLVNGKPYRLSDASNQRIWKARLYRVVWGPRGYFYEGSKKNLTRVKNAKKVLTWLVQNLQGEPQQLIDALRAAAEKAK
jgi:hypothetical protein